MALQADGKIVTAGNPGTAGAMDNGQAVVRYLADGRLDPGFGSSGVVKSLAPPSSGNGGGYLLRREPSPRSGGRRQGSDRDGRRGVGSSVDMALTRYTPTGLLDSSFGRSGWMKIERDTDNDEISALAIQPDGAVVFAGSVDVLKLLAVGRIPAPDTSTTIRAWGWNGPRPAGRRLDDPAELPVARSPVRPRR